MTHPFFKKLEALNESYANSKYNTNPEITDKTRRKYFDQEIKEVRKLFQQHVAKMEIIKEFANGLCKYAIYDKDGEFIGELHDSTIKIKAIINADKNSVGELEAAGKALYGDRWQTDLAKALGLSDARRIRQWLTGDRPVPTGIWADMAAMLRQRNKTINKLLSDLTE